MFCWDKGIHTFSPTEIDFGWRWRRRLKQPRVYDSKADLLFSLHQPTIFLLAVHSICFIFIIHYSIITLFYKTLLYCATLYCTSVNCIIEEPVFYSPLICIFYSLIRFFIGAVLVPLISYFLPFTFACCLQHFTLSPVNDTLNTVLAYY